MELFRKVELPFFILSQIKKKQIVSIPDPVDKSAFLTMQCKIIESSVVILLYIEAAGIESTKSTTLYDIM